MDPMIIIGAGAAGLMAGRQLSAAGYPVTILEAAPVAGGRVLTLSAGGTAGFSVAAEGGAEFIHGDLPLSLQLAEEAGATPRPVASHMVRMQQGQPPGKEQEETMSRDWGQLMQRMGKLQNDLPFADFLEKSFPGDRYRGLRDSVGRMAEGYDLADLQRVSTQWLYREWVGEWEEEEEYRPEGGYQRLIDHLTAVCLRQGCQIHFSTPVTAVRWQRGRVEAIGPDGRVFVGGRLVTTVSLGVLQTGGIQFSPVLPRHGEAIGRLGFGSVIKVLLEFRNPWWNDKKRTGQTLFVISDAPVPTWWTQTPDDCPLLTGWIAGRNLRPFRALSGQERIDTCLGSLASIFSIEATGLREELRTSMILDWETAPFIRGGYSFETIGGEADRTIMGTPIGETLYFAGEAVYEGPAPGTVEAAFRSGVEVAEKMLR